MHSLPIMGNIDLQCREPRSCRILHIPLSQSFDLLKVHVIENPFNLDFVSTDFKAVLFQ